jgi:uncharacterized YigZ family protein
MEENIMDKNYFYSVEHQQQTTIKIKRSVFICTLEYVESIDSAKKFISRISKENKTANHNCWAYIVGEKAEVFHSSDAGEPSGTAGKPMLNILQGHHMTNIAVVVTRYFGGVKLGVRGLIEAYGAVVKNAIDEKKLKKLIKTINIFVEVSYEFNDILLNQMKNYSTIIQATSYTDKVVHTFEIEFSDFYKVENLLSEYQARKKLAFNIIDA